MRPVRGAGGVVVEEPRPVSRSIAETESRGWLELLERDPLMPGETRLLLPVERPRSVVGLVRSVRDVVLVREGVIDGAV